MILKWPFLFFQTYCVDQQTTDSASSASAMLTGVKTIHKTVGFDHKIELGIADSISKATKVNSLAYHAQKAGKDTGFVTTTRVTHATPSATYAQSAHRDWECYGDLVKDDNGNTDLEKKVQDIARQLIYNEPGNKMKVMMGGGRPAFFPKSDKPKPKEGPDYDSYTWECYSNEYVPIL